MVAIYEALEALGYEEGYNLFGINYKWFFEFTNGTYDIIWSI